MDDINRYVGNAEMFPILRSWDFYNHAGVSPLPHASAQAVIDYARQAEAHSYLNAGWRPAIDQARGAAAGLLNCSKAEIAFVKSTADGLSIVARGIDWRSGDRIVTTSVEYPTNMYPWMDVAKRYGVDLVVVAEETDKNGARAVPLAKLLEAAAKPGVKAVAVSHVEFGSGQRIDLAAIGAFCRERGILLIVDAIQSFGAVPIDVTAMKIDYLSAGGQKWLLSPEGTGIFYCRKELLEKTPPLVVGAMSVVNFMDFENYNLNLKPDAGRFESGGMNVAGLMGMAASLDLFTRVGMGAISSRLKKMGDQLIEGVLRKGYTIGCPRDGEQWSGIVSFASSKGSHEEIVANLKKEHRIELAVRHGRIRASAHFYNTEEQVERLVGGLPGN